MTTDYRRKDEYEMVRMSSTHNSARSQYFWRRYNDPSMTPLRSGIFTSMVACKRSIGVDADNRGVRPAIVQKDY